jgi:myotubularin-related protein 1/2
MSAEFMLDDKDWVVFPKDEPEEIEFEDIEGITNCLDGEEEILTKHNVTMNFTQMHLKATGFLLVTNFRLCFLNFSSNGGPLSNNSVPSYDSVSVPLTAISSIVTSDGNKSSYSNFIISQPVYPELEIKTKDVRCLQFRFESINDRDETMNVLMEHVFFGPTNIGATFAFVYGKTFLRRNLPQKREWIYSVEDEFFRLAFSLHQFKVSSLNSDYKLCPTYPKKFILPVTVSDDVVKKSTSFRSHRRLPAVVWIHPDTQATISRCSQPKVGIRGARSEADETLVKAIFSANPHYGMSHREKKMYIIDCRPKLLASANLFRGAGFENPEYYGHCKIEFMNLDNIRSIRSSFQAMMSLYCSREAPDRLALEGTKWMEHIKSLLAATIKLCRLVAEEGVSIVVHCSDGWDRTTQLVSLVELLLDPYYRTLCGFCVLIQKEWLSFGHKFRDRVGHGISEEASSEYSPIFLQWIDAVYQVMSQYPNYFEFNEYFLIVLLDNVINCRFGTFLANCEKEWSNLQIEEKTVNFWDWLYRTGMSQYFKNPDYISKNEALVPDDSTSRLQFWASYYARYRIEMKQSREHMLRTQQTRIQIAQLKRKLQQEVKKNEIYERLIFEQLKDRDDFKTFLKKVLQKPRDKREYEFLEFQVDWQGEKLVFRVSSKLSDNNVTDHLQKSPLSQKLSWESPSVQRLYRDLDNITIDNYFQEGGDSTKKPKKPLSSLLHENDHILQSKRSKIAPNSESGSEVVPQNLTSDNSTTYSLLQSLHDTSTNYMSYVALNFSRIFNWFRRSKTEELIPSQTNNTEQLSVSLNKRENGDDNVININDFEQLQVTEDNLNNNNIEKSKS